jgi:Kef-type K+ transport system membrane component KefB
VTLSVGFVLAVLCAAGFFGPLIAEALNLPSAAVELVIGFGLSFLVPASALAKNGPISNLGALGFLILMFLVGTEFDLREIWNGSRSSVVMGVVLFTTSVAASFMFVGHLSGVASIWILAGAATSVGVAAPVLHSHGWNGSRFARDVLVVGSVAEILYLATLTALSVQARHGSGQTAVLLGVRATLLVVFAVTLVQGIRRLRARVPRHFHRWFRRDDPIELGLRGTFALLFVVVAFSSLVQIPNVLGSMLAGVIFRSVIGNAKAILERLSSVANSFFIPIFFLTVGLQTNLREGIAGLVPTMGVVLLALSASRLILVPFLKKRGHSMRQGFAGSFLLMAPLTLLITTAEIGETGGFLDPNNVSAMIVTATVSSLIFPAVGKRLLGFKGESALQGAIGPQELEVSLSGEPS